MERKGMEKNIIFVFWRIKKKFAPEKTAEKFYARVKKA